MYMGCLKCTYASSGMDVGTKGGFPYGKTPNLQAAVA
jgi:hypothetical protein